MKRIIILGSTGSIGRATLKVVKENPDKFEVIGLSARKNTSLLNKQIEEFRPSYVSILDKGKAKALRINKGLKILAGEEGLEEISKKKCDILVLGVPGLSALKPLFSCLGRAKKVLLANKEAIISAGEIVKERAKNENTELFPVDSEAWAVFNLLKKEEREDILSVYLTASGGPFWDKPKEIIKNVKAEEAIRHPVWKMGKKISVDSATLMNKGFEVIEIKRLFNIDSENIKILIHPQSVVHAFLEKRDKSLISCMFYPDMRIPISSGLGIDNFSLKGKKLLLDKIKGLEFFLPDYKKFPLLNLAYFVANKEKSFPTVLVSADEEVVDFYLKEKVSFSDIPKIIERVIAKHKPGEITSLEDVYYWEAWAKEKVKELVF